MAQLNDCAFLTSMELIDAGLGTPSVTFNTNYIVKGGNKMPALNATWALTGDIASIHVTGIQFEYGPSAMTSGTVLSEANKNRLAWATTNSVIMGESYTIRRRFIGAGERVFGPWSTPVNIVAGEEWVASPASFRGWDAVSGTSRTILETRGGDLRFRSGLVDQVNTGAAVQAGSTLRPLAVQPFPLLVADGVPVAFGDLGVFPNLSWQYDNLDSLLTGETYEFTALSPSPTGFTPSLKIRTAGATTDVVRGPSGSTSDATRQYIQTLGAVPNGGIVEVTCGGNVRSYFTNPDYNPSLPPTAPSDNSSQDGYLVIFVWAYNGTVWRNVGSIYVWPNYRSGGAYGDPPGFYDDAYAETGTVNLGVSDTQVGVSVGYEDYAASSITSMRLNFQTTGSSGVRTATPGGRKTTVIVQPKNST